MPKSCCETVMTPPLPIIVCTCMMMSWLLKTSSAFKQPSFASLDSDIRQAEWAEKQLSGP
ncbi:hypothetical protein L798_03740 [Zootermopsis nevadensis]|uniref:Uncharacterized protein n=1 Tax=Zootermopsis nevadensis TaxID=136037 RepID=A0A067RTE6_ZOONE|nr:hypothetical protein L798_03740 [Zootermopsis nevadensis]